MSERDRVIVDLIASPDGHGFQTIEKRIERRLEVLREWLSDGIPVGKSIPTSLTRARLWEDEDLRIQAIKSPNEFTTTHREHGRSVRDISELLTALLNRNGRPGKTTSRPATVAKFDRKALDEALQAAVSQWHTERALHLQAKARANGAENRSNMLLDENAEKDRLIADLRRQLVTQRGLKAVE